MESRERPPAASQVGLRDRSSVCAFPETKIDAGTNSKISASNPYVLRNRWMLSIFLVTLFVALCYGLIGLPYYETNDDMAMTAIVSGGAFLEHPDEHMLFSHVYLGLVLKQLYLAMPAVPWYGILQTAAIFISMIVVTWLVTGKSRSPLMMFGIASGALLISCVRPLLLMQFTISAALAACAGTMLLLEACERWHLRKRAIKCAIGALLLISLSCIFRGASSFLVLIVTTLFTVCRFTPNPVRQWRKGAGQLLALGAAIAMVAGFNYANESYYRGEWSDFYQVNRANSSIREYGCDRIDSPLRRSIFQQVGWTLVDEKLHANWYMLDKNLHSKEKLITLSKLLHDNRAALFDMERAMSTVQAILMNKLFPLTLSLLFLVPFINRKKFPLASSLLLSASVLSLLAIFIGVFKLPVHVFDSIVMTLTLLAIRYISVSRVAEIFSFTPPRKQLVRRTALGILLLAALAPSFWLMSNLQVHLKFMARLERSFKLAMKSISPQPNQIYVTWAASPSIILSPFTDLARTFHNFKAIPVASISRTPFVSRRLQENGIQDILRELDRDNIYLVSSDRYNIALLRMYAAEKLGKEVVVTPVPVNPPMFEVFKVSYVAPATPEKLKRDLTAALITRETDEQVALSNHSETPGNE